MDPLTARRYPGLACGTASYVTLERDRRSIRSMDKIQRSVRLVDKVYPPRFVSYSSNFNCHYLGLSTVFCLVFT